jgi:hypothetical protein
MKVTINPAVARKIIRAGLWPQLEHPECAPRLAENGEVITFFDWRDDRKQVVGKMKADGSYWGAKRNVQQMVDLAAQIGEELGLIVKPPKPPSVKKVRKPSANHLQPSADIADNTAKSTKQTQKPSAPKPEVSLRDMMNRRKQER